MFKPLRKVSRKLLAKKNNGSSASKPMNSTSKFTSSQLAAPANYELSVPISKDLNENETYIKKILGDVPDVGMHRFHVLTTKNEKKAALLIYINQLVDSRAIHNFILEPLNQSTHYKPILDSPIAEIKQRINVSDIKEETDINRCINVILHNQVLFLIDGHDTGILINVSGAENRSLDEPPTEPVVRGPRIGFIESIYENMTLLRRQIHHPSLRFEIIQLGTLSQTKVAISYIVGIAQPDIIDEARRRLKQIEVDSIISSGELEQMIEDHPYSIFPTLSNTERPDRAATQMLEGRFVIIVDGDPIALVAPYLFMESFQSPEDYGSRPYYASFVRLLCIIAFTLSITLPAIFITALNFHKETIPSELIVSMTGAREVVPFPVPLETFIMIILFEVVREAGIRMPRPIGQAVSIVGALILGDVSVSAGLVGAPTIIVVAFSTIASFAITRITDVMAILRIGLLIPASLFGAYGLLMALLGLVTHTLSLKSFGVAYMSPLTPFHFRDWGDTFIRLPLNWLRKRPHSIPNQREERIKRLPFDQQEEQP